MVTLAESRSNAKLVYDQQYSRVYCMVILSIVGQGYISDYTLQGWIKPFYTMLFATQRVWVVRLMEPLLFFSDIYHPNFDPYPFNNDMCIYPDIMAMAAMGQSPCTLVFTPPVSQVLTRSLPHMSEYPMQPNLYYHVMITFQMIGQTLQWCWSLS